MWPASVYYFGPGAVFSMVACSVFSYCVPAFVPLIGGVTGVVMTGACPGYPGGPPCYSVSVTTLLGCRAYF